MDILRWNKETRQAYVGTLLYSLLNILAAILGIITAIGAIAMIAGGGGGLMATTAVLLVITEILVICGYIIFFLAIRGLKSITDGDVQNAFKKIYLSIIFDIVAALLGIFKLGIIGGILGIVSCILLVMAYSALRKSPAIAELSEGTRIGFNRLFTAEVLSIVAICISIIPLISAVGGVLKIIAFVMVIMGWKMVAAPLAVNGETPVEKPLFDTIKEVVNESIEDAKELGKNIGRKSEIVAEEIETKVNEAHENIKEKLDNMDENKEEQTPGENV